MTQANTPMQPRIFGRIALAFVAILLALSTILVYSAQGSENDECATSLHQFKDFPRGVSNDNDPIEGGTLHIGIATYMYFTGMFNPLFHASVEDGHVLRLLIPPLLTIDSTSRFSNNGAARFEYDLEALTFTITLVEEIFWHDGVLLTLDDLLFAYEVIAHPWYFGPRFHGAATLIEGVWEYHNGDTDTISGITLSHDNMTMTISFTEMTPAMLYSGIWTTPLPRHHFEGVSVWEMADHENSWHMALGYGPFIIDYIVPGEYVALVRNDNFWMGAPYLEGIIVEVISRHVADEYMIHGMSDVLLGITGQLHMYVPDPINFTYLAAFANSISFTAFRHGITDPDTGRYIMDPYRVVADVNLRRAMGYAINEAAIAEQVIGAVHVPANTVLPPALPVYWNSEMAGFSVFDPDLANRILDDAGYTKRDAEGYRMTPDGQPITLNWALHLTPFHEVMAHMMIEDWANIGIRVVLWGGDFIELSSRTEILHYDLDEGEIDLYDIAFALGINPDPMPLWGPYASINFSRYTTPELDEILDNFASMDMFDTDFAIQAYHRWQEYFYENVPAIPRRYSATVIAVNNRVQNMELARVGDLRDATINFYNSHLWRVTAGRPYSIVDMGTFRPSTAPDYAYMETEEPSLPAYVSTEADPINNVPDDTGLPENNQPADRAHTGVVSNSYFLNLRRGPGMRYPAFSYLAAGDIVTIVATQGNWAKVESHRGIGWVFTNYLNIANAPRESAIMTGSASTFSSGMAVSFAIDEDNVLWGWGINTSGQLGNGTLTE
ncbi:MAG: ABC transporter substrate-binding protein [Defluviitaleaceae bacterium]|nr:ABC transporter substrate-binding protein [Defluviitaleaceae bacterium]